MKKYPWIIPIIICITFILLYGILAFVRHIHYQSYGYDLGINDQTVWKYSHLEIPLTTIDPSPDRVKLTEHIELVYAIIAPFYWIWNSVYMLLSLQVIALCSSAFALYLLGRKYGIRPLAYISVMIAYLMFFGVQFSLWTDVHSSVFATSFFMWFIYFLDTRQHKFSFLFFLLTLTAKESTGTALFFISFVYFLYRKERMLLIYMFLSFLYTIFVFFVFFPVIMHVPYLYANHAGILSNLDPLSLINTDEKRITIVYSFASWGFLPIFSPLLLLPVLSHFYKFFVLASDLTGAQGLFGHYRVMIAPILSVASLWTIRRFSHNKQLFLSLWIIISVVMCQYFLHLPLSYLSKSWFWTQPDSVETINTIVRLYIPNDVSIVAQNNIVPHMSHRDAIYSLYPERKNFTKHSPCGQTTCDWFRWYGNPTYLLVDISSDWDARHLLIDREAFLRGLENLERVKIISTYQQLGTTRLYLVHSNPENYK